MTSDRRTDIVDPATIADLFVDFTRNGYAVTLCFEHTRIHYPVTVVSVDVDSRSCLLDITSAGDIDNEMIAQRAFVLHARQPSATLHSEPMRGRCVLERGDRLGLRCALPECVELRRERGDFRATLAEDMTVAVELTYPPAAIWHGQLCDLSVGGGLICLPSAQAADLAMDGARYHLRARFPNGETFETYGRISHRYNDKATQRTYVGVAFDIGVEHDQRRVWAYVREIEREYARKASARHGLRSLAPSPLFERADKTPDQDSEPGTP